MKKRIAACVLIAIGLIIAYPFVAREIGEPDFAARDEFVALEDTLRDNIPFDPGAWQEFVSLARELEARKEQLRESVRREFAFDLYAHSRSMLYPPMPAAAPEINETDKARFRDAIVLSRVEFMASGLPERIGRVLAHPGLRPPPFTDAITLTHAATEMDHHALRAISSALAWLADDAARSGDVASFRTHLRDQFRLARMVTKRPASIALIVGRSLEYQGFMTVDETVTLDACTPEMRIAALDELLANAALPAMTEEAIIDGERLFGLDMIRALYDGDELAPGVRPNPLVVWWKNPSENTTREDFDRLIDSARVLAATPRPQAEDLTETPDRILDALAGESMFFNMHAPLLGDLMRMIDGQQCYRGATILRTAILVHRDQTGALPYSLDDLIDAGVLKALPEDPYAADARFRYRTDPATPLGFVLYSVGINAEDHGGTPHPEEGHIRSIS
ncbi:MAG: hypothetical protein AAGH64_09865, partial [Planctomycetota bacterium]